jgi:hypothetical protein
MEFNSAFKVLRSSLWIEYALGYRWKRLPPDKSDKNKYF